MRRFMLAPVFAVAGLLLALSGCVGEVSTGGPRYSSPPPSRAYYWGQGQPRLVIIEGTGVSYAADCNEDIYFCDGAWYRFYGGGWYSCRTHGGAWVAIGAPPPAFGRIPPGHAKFHPMAGEPKGPPPGHGPRWK
jgi:hypothetical protein